MLIWNPLRVGKHSFVWNRHYNLGKFNIISVCFKKKKSVSTVTEILVCPRLVWIIFVNLQGKDPLTLLSGGLSKYNGITSSLRNLEARFPTTWQLLVIPSHWKGFSFSAKPSGIKAFKSASAVCLGHTPLWTLWKMIWGTVCSTSTSVLQLLILLQLENRTAG